MAIERAPDGQGENIIVASPDVSVLVVRSEIAGLSFLSTRGILEVGQPANGIYHVKVEPGVNVFTINAPGFQAITSYRLAMPKKDAITVDVSVLKTASGARGTLRIETSPAGATITLNGVTLADKTPVTLPNQPTGSNNIRLEANGSGYASIDTTVVIDMDQTTRLNVTLPHLLASLRVTSDPPGALVVLDGDELGITPLTRSDLTPGNKTLAVLLDGYEPVTQPVRLSTGGEPATINTYLVRVTGRLEVTTIPEGVEVFIDSETLGRYEGKALIRDELEPGIYSVRTTLEGHHDSTLTVTIKGGHTTEVTLTLDAITGAIYVISTPSGASVQIDGRDTGVSTPSRIDDLSIGNHSITLSKPGYQDASEMVTTRPGIAETLTIRLEERQTSEASSSKYTLQNTINNNYQKRIQLGVTLNINSSGVFENETTDMKERKNGGGIGLFVDAGVSSNISTYIEFGYCTKGYNYNSLSWLDRGEGLLVLRYIVLDCMLKYNIIKYDSTMRPSTPFIMAGIQFERLIDAYYDDNQEIDLFNAMLDIGITGCIGYQFDYGLQTDIRYTLGFIENEFYFMNIKNNCLSLVLAYSWSI